MGAKQIDELIQNQNDILLQIQSLIETSQGDYSAFIQTTLGGVMSAIAGAVFAYAFSRLHYNADLENKRKIDCVERLKGALEKFESLCDDYWGEDYDAMTNRHMTSKITLHHKRLLRLVAAYGKLPHVYDLDFKKITNLAEDLYDDATGGLFASKSRVASKRVQRQVSYACDDMLAYISY